MPSEKQRSAARRNIRKAASAAKKKRTIAHLPKATRTALGKAGSQGCEREAPEEGCVNRSVRKVRVAGKTPW